MTNGDKGRAIRCRHCDALMCEWDDDSAGISFPGNGRTTFSQFAIVQGRVFPDREMVTIKCGCGSETRVYLLTTGTRTEATTIPPNLADGIPVSEFRARLKAAEKSSQSSDRGETRQ